MSSKGAGTVPGEQDQQSRLVPALRFPEFRDVGGWEFKTLNHLLSEPKQRNRDLKYGPGDVLSVSGEYGCVNQIEFMGRSYAGVSVKDYHVVETGDVVYTKSPLKVAPFGIIKANKGRSGIVSTLYAVYRPTADACADYIDHYFSRNYNLNSYLQPIVKKGAKNDMKVKNSDVLTGSVWVPKIDEQKKIADCLSSIDTLIAAEAEKLEALRGHKKGLMQQLFPAPGETTPRLRFPEFEDAGAWDEVELGAIADIKLGKMLDNNKNTSGHFLPYLNNISVRWNNIDLSNLPKMYFSDKEMDRFSLKYGDVVVCEGGEPGRSAVWDGRMPDLKFQKAIHRVRFNVPFEPKLLVLHLENLAGTSRFEMLFTGGGIQHLTLESFSKLKVPLTTFAEQQKIAGCLSSIDSIIAAQGDRIDALKAHKLGLIQQLFPVADQVQA